MLLEVCVDSFESVCQAIKGGAKRIELCSALSEGGLSPTSGFMIVAKEYAMKENVPVYAMLRPRRGNDFQYTPTEMNIILSDLEDFRKFGADGFVFGALNERNEINWKQCQQIIEAAKGLPVTFHRAFDLTDPNQIVETAKHIQKLGFSRILTSGLQKTAELGVDNIAKLCKIFSNDGDMIIMPGAGINSDNLATILDRTGCKEFHASARLPKYIATNRYNVSMEGDDDNESLLVTDWLVVSELVKIASNFKKIPKI